MRNLKADFQISDACGYLTVKDPKDPWLLLQGEKDPKV